MITASPLRTVATSIVLDCTAPGQPLIPLLAWVQGAPSTSNIHVYLRSSMQDGESRKIKNSLQALGCRVTLRAHVLAR